ncbi:MAG: hypothetical protein HFE97_07715 [Oscillospiraceae bacterium]|nr:hypothetical protein [Oscillospiraceae bacterium]
MYNRYIPNGATYTRVVMDDGPPDRPLEASQAVTTPPPQPPIQPEGPPPDPKPAPQPEVKKSGLAGLLQGLKLDSLDTGDILLLLILLFLFLEGDDTELLITLALLLLLGLD